MELLSVIPADETEGRGVGRIARTADPLLVIEIAMENRVFGGALVDCLFVNRLLHSRAATLLHKHRCTISRMARMARGWLTRHGTVYEGTQYFGHELLRQDEPSLALAMTMMRVNYGPGVAKWNPPARDIQVADLNVLMKRINKWMDAQRQKGEMLQQDGLKKATIVDVYRTPYLLVRYRIFHGFISHRNVWRDMQSDFRHFLDVETADADDDDDEDWQSEEDPDFHMTITRNIHMYRELLI